MAARLRHAVADEADTEQADDAEDSEDSSLRERSRHDWEQQADEEGADPVERGCKARSAAADGQREDLADDDPGERCPREGIECNVDAEEEDNHHRVSIRDDAVDDSWQDEREAHDRAADRQQRAAVELICDDEEDQRAEDEQDALDDRPHELRAGSLPRRLLDDQRDVVEDCICTLELLEGCNANTSRHEVAVLV